MKVMSRVEGEGGTGGRRESGIGGEGRNLSHLAILEEVYILSD